MPTSPSSAPGLPIKAVVFDYGGVIISPITNKLAVIADQHGVDMAFMLEVLMGPMDRSTDHPWHALERGEGSVGELQDRLTPVAAAAGITLRGDEIATLYEPTTHHTHAQVVDRIWSLKEAGYLTGLLSNVNAEYVAQMRLDFDDFAMFTHPVASAEVGTRKPEPAIYEHLESMLGVTGPEIVFLDDFAPNLEPARSRGWSTIHVTDPDTALADLDALLE